MKLLAWDTSSKTGALAAMEWEAGSSPRLVSEWTLNVQSTQQSERLLWGIDELLKASNWKLGEVDYLGVGVGPGSFTGLRIGVTTARTLAHTLKKPLIGFSSLAALARPVALWMAENKTPALVIATTDACKGELYSLFGNAKSVIDCVALAEGDAPGLWKRGVEEDVLTPSELMKRVKKKLTVDKKLQWVAVGEGRSRYAEAWKALPASRELKVPAPFSDFVQGRYAGLLAWEACQAGIAREALSVHPRYVRASDAELKLKAGLLPPGPSRGHDRKN
jgi:tRNA threonylcarbamoyladenosine biosynthesis protein TsaB